jgi:hypothetical protein
VEHPSDIQPVVIDLGAGDAAVVAMPRRKAPIFLAAALAVALVVTAAAFIGYRLLFGGAEPAERMPASVIAYLSLDLNPGLDQTRKLLKLSEKLPETGGRKDAKSVLEKALESLDLQGIDVKRDLTPWLGQRLAVAAWPGGTKQPIGLLAVQSTDDRAAMAGLTRIKESAKASLGFTVRDGYALIAVGGRDAQSGADAASAEAAKSPLTKSAKYSEARKWLDGDQFAVFFADLDGYAKAISTAMPTAPMALKTDVTGMPTGTFIAGVRAEDDGLSARFRSFGGKATPAQPATDAVGKLGALPAGTSVGVVARLSGEFNPSPFLLFGLPMGFDSETTEEPSSSLTPQEDEEFNTLIGKQISGKLTKAEQKRLEELSAKMFGPTTSPKDLTPAEQKELDALITKGNLTEAEQKRLDELLGIPGGFDPRPDNSQSGKAMEDLLGSLSGALVTVAATDLSAKPAFKAIVELAQTPNADMAKELTSLAGKDVTVKLDGATLSVQSVGYAGSGRLSDDPLFRRASAGAGSGAQMAIYVDLTRLKAGPYKAIFVTGSGDSGSARVLIG